MIRPSVHLALFFSVALASPPARAQQAQWLDGSFGYQGGLACLTWNVEAAVTTFAGYWGTTTGSFPKTGDVTYVRAVAAVVGNPCAGYDAIGFDFQMPKGATLAISAQTPVQCLATRLSDGYVTTTDPNIHCSQTPAAGTSGGLSFGWAVVTRGWTFEIRVPVELDRELLGMSGPASDNLKVATSSGNGTVVVEAWVNAPYRALVNYPSPSATYLSTTTTGTTYRLTSYLYNFYESGTAAIEAGVAPGSYGGPYGAAAISGAGNGYTMSTDLTFVPGFAGVAYWRTRFDTSSGTFYGPEQSFTVNGSTPATYGLTVTKTGAGSVTSDPQGLSCGASCSQSFTAGTVVTLTAIPDPGSEFSGWSGACSGTGSCVVSMTGSAAVTAAFAPAPVPTIGTLDVTVSGLPAGAIGSIAVIGPGGFSRVFDLMSGTGQSLSDVAPGEYTGVVADVSSGGSTYVGRPATLSTGVLAGGKGVIAASYELGRQLTVSKSGSGSGSVSSTPGGVSCGATCSAAFASSEEVTLSASPDAGSVFAGYGGACSGATCTVTMSADRSVTALFEPAAAGTYTLSVTRHGTGQGTVTSSPAGVDCGAICNYNFAPATTVTLEATPYAGSLFTGWSGACSGSGACTVTMSAASTVSATFDLPGAASYGVAARASASAPADATRAKGDSRVPMLAFDLDGSLAGQLDSVTLRASGSGNDAGDLTAVELYEDANGNGEVDAGETAVASGTFGADDGTLVLTPAFAPSLPAGVAHYLVTVSVATTLIASIARIPQAVALAGMGGPSLALALLACGMLVATRRRARRLWGSAVLLFALAACSGSTPSTTTGRTYQLTLTAVAAQSGGQPATVAGLPIAGAEIDVQP